jgi:hypothetical protein
MRKPRSTENGRRTQQVPALPEQTGIVATNAQAARCRAALCLIGGHQMRKTFAVLAAVGAVAATAIAAPAPAEARGIGPGLAFGLAAGALTAGAIAASGPYYYGPGYGYGYYGPRYYYGPGPYAYYGGPYPVYRHHYYYRHW